MTFLESTKTPNVFRFDDFEVDEENFSVTKKGEVVAFTPKAFDVLCLLLAKSGKVVEKHTIFESIWKETFVSDHALTKVLKEIRQALGDPARAPKYVETIPKRGYRFIGDVERVNKPVEAFPPPGVIADKRRSRVERSEVSSGPLDSMLSRFGKSARLAFFLLALFGVLALGTFWWLGHQPVTQTSGGGIRSVAVLPFRPVSAESRNESLEMGMAETLITRLSNVREIAVRPVTSVNNYLESGKDPVAYGKEIGVDAILDGTVQNDGERVRITARLIDVPSGKQLWAEHFDEAYTDIFKVQDSIAERVTDGLTVHLTNEEHQQLTKHLTENPEAYQLYLNAQLVWNGRRQNWIDQSLSLYQAAIGKDPNFALAYIGMVDCYIMRNGHHRASAEETIKAIRPLINKALELDDSLAQSHNALAEFRYQYEFNWVDSEIEFKKAIELNPNIAWTRQAYGWFLMSMGRFAEANVQMELAHELDPSSLTINAGRGSLLYYTKQYDRAIEHFKNMISVEPNDPSLYGALYQVYAQTGDYDDAIVTHASEMKSSGKSETAIKTALQVYRTKGWVGFLNMQLETLRDADTRGDADAISFATAYIRLGQNDDAFFWLEKAVDARESSIAQLMIDPVFETIRTDRRFSELIRKLGLDPASRSDTSHS